ncbi:MAG TPA: dihydropteroate synthase [Candidatus Limnocylindria bacterium]|nr:dihydropteroate synthase [Candidatus Limnocylindria bacterium]
MLWRCRDRTFDLAERSLVMGVVNVTPDSFSDGGRFLSPDAAAEQTRLLIAEGADLVDLGAESTRPGAAAVAPEEQWRRLEPVFAALACVPEPCLSVDTASPWVAERALGAGARVINDVTALGDPAMAQVAVGHDAGVVLMHMRGSPASMQDEPRYDDAATEIASWLGDRLAAARMSGIADEQIALDPGIGFGKSPRHNLELLARLEECVALGRPVAVGVSRKRFIGALLDLPVDERLEGGLAAAAVAVFLGARIIRTHDVRATVRAVRVADALRAARRAQERIRS